MSDIRVQLLLFHSTNRLGLDFGLVPWFAGVRRRSFVFTFVLALANPLYVPSFLAVMAHNVNVDPTFGHGLCTDPTAVAGRYGLAGLVNDARRVHLRRHGGIASRALRLVLQGPHTLCGGFHV